MPPFWKVAISCPLFRIVAPVVVALLRWIDHLKDLGSVDESLRLAKDCARRTLIDFAEEPGFGARALAEEIIVPEQVTTLYAPKSGFLQLIDIGRMDACLPNTSAIYISVHPGDHILEDQPLALASRTNTQRTEGGNLLRQF